MKQILEAAYKAWCAGAELRERRRRYKNYTYGQQWADIVRDDKGRYIREDEMMKKQGATPLSNNLIRQLVKTIVGRYRNLQSENDSYSAPAISAMAQRNSLPELDTRLLEEFLISGMAIQRISRERRWEGQGVWVDNVDPERFFVNAFRDPRGHDIKLIGMLHDMSLPELINRFADTQERADELKHLYGRGDEFASPVSLGATASPEDFFNASEPGLCRVIEVWTFDCRPGADDSPKLDFAWHCRYLSAEGILLSEHDSPYGHGMHPFAVKMYPLTGGEVHSFVEDVIDQQRYINRLVVLLDKMMASSAKGVLLFPEDQKTDHDTWDRISQAWASSDGVIPITGKGQFLPQQVQSSGSDGGVYRLLELQMKLFEDISGVGQALLGRSNGTARGVEMFDTQVKNATIALADIFETFNSFTAARNRKAVES